MHAFLHGHPLFLEFAIGLVFCGCFVMTAANLSEIEQLLAFAVRDALAAAHIEVKLGAACMGLDESQFRKQLRAEPSQHISLTRLIRLPFSFWLFFGPSLISLVYKKRMLEMAEGLADVKRSA